MIHHIDVRNNLSIAELMHIFGSGARLQLSDHCRDLITENRAWLEQKIGHNTQAFYGINTGFGALCKQQIDNDHLEDLQLNLIRSHACGTGKELDGQLVRLMLLLKVQSLGYGYSGVRLETVDRLLSFYNNEIYPVVYEDGSLGASGDLVPLAHLCLPLIGEGEVYYHGMRYSGLEINKIMGWEPLKLGAKEGLALLNGTQFMLALALYNLHKATQLWNWANATTALSLDVFYGNTDAFHPLVQKVRPHEGQTLCASEVLEWLKDSSLMLEPRASVQDPYSFRCVPQVHGATYDALQYVKKVVETELNSVTDNPIVSHEEDLILSGGNFHGQPLALAMDMLAIAMAEIGNISERRTYLLVSGQRGLPEFLAGNPGLESGMMIPQYVAAALVSKNKGLAMPASVDSIVSSNGQEDHVSMGANAGLKLHSLIENLSQILAIEWLCALQGYHYRQAQHKKSTSPSLHQLIEKFRKEVQVKPEDHIWSGDIRTTARFIQNEICLTYRNLPLPA